LFAGFVLDDKTTRLDRFDGWARDVNECDLVAGLVQQGADGAAHGAGSEDGKFHGVRSLEIVHC